MNAVKGIRLEFIVDGRLKTATLIQREDGKGKYVEVHGNIITVGDYTGTVKEIDKIFLTPEVMKYNGQRKNLKFREYKTTEEVLKTQNST